MEQIPIGSAVSWKLARESPAAEKNFDRAQINGFAPVDQFYLSTAQCLLKWKR
jgi:hypothetical protein